MPEQIEVCYPGTSYTVTLVGLALPDYVGIVGTPWTQTLHRYETLASVNGTSLSDLSDQFATDWYNWQRADQDQYFVGIYDWTPEGLHDLTFTQMNGKITTRVQRREFNSAEDLLYFFSDPDYVIVLVNGELVNGKFDALIQLRDDDAETWSDDIPVWGIDLNSAPDLAIGMRITNRVRDLDRIPSIEVGGVFYLSLANSNLNNELSDLAFWFPLVPPADPSSPLIYGTDVVSSTAVIDGPLTMNAGANLGQIQFQLYNPGAGITAGGWDIVGYDGAGNKVSETVSVTSGAGTNNYDSVNLYAHIVSITASGFIGEVGGDTVTVVITEFPAGSLVSSGGDVYYSDSDTATVPPGAGWNGPITPSNAGGWNGDIAYDIWDCVQEIRQLYAFESGNLSEANPSLSGSIVTDPVTGTAVGPDYQFKSPGGSIDISASGSSPGVVEYDVDDTWLATEVAGLAPVTQIITSPYTDISTGPVFTFSSPDTTIDISADGGSGVEFKLHAPVALDKGGTHADMSGTQGVIIQATSGANFSAVNSNGNAAYYFGGDLSFHDGDSRWITQTGLIAPGTYTVGSRLTGGGNDGTITVNAFGQITAIQQAT